MLPIWTGLLVTIRRRIKILPYEHPVWPFCFWNFNRDYRLFYKYAFNVKVLKILWTVVTFFNCVIIQTLYIAQVGITCWAWIGWIPTNNNNNKALFGYVSIFYHWHLSPKLQLIGWQHHRHIKETQNAWKYRGKYLPKIKEDKDQESIKSSIYIPHLTRNTIWESDKTQGHITHKRAKRSALSQQVVKMLQGTDKTV